MQSLEEGTYVRIVSPLWQGWYGRIVFIGSDRIEVELADTATIPFLPSELEPAERPSDVLRWVYAE